MKKQQIFRLCVCLAVALCNLSLMAQGVIVYKKNGTLVKFSYEAIDSIVTYNSGKDVKAVDLGLSVKWATCNVGANSSEEYGGYYAWGEIEEKNDYSIETYKWANGSYFYTKYCTDSSRGIVDGKTTLGLEDDVAHTKWGGEWRIPTYQEMYELFEKCTWTWTSLNGVNGCIVTGPSGNSIFLPAAGYRDGWYTVGEGGYLNYRCNETEEDGGVLDLNYKYYSEEGEGNLYDDCSDRSFGCPVRPVKE